MSHANGLVRFPDGEVMHFEYDGTSDIVCRSLKRTYPELKRDWRTAANQADCNCGQPAEKVEMFTDYGRGFSWEGKACRRCMAVTDATMPFDTDVAVWDRVPEWAKAGHYNP